MSNVAAIDAILRELTDRYRDTRLWANKQRLDADDVSRWARLASMCPNEVCDSLAVE